MTQTRQTSANETVDIFIIGGGVNGVGIARDAAGRGLSVTLAEAGDLAQATSSAATKLIHGGLRYLEFYEFSLVRKALKEREVLLRAMPHIARPMRFVLPHHTGLRPFWLLRLGLFIYDHLGGRKILPKTRVLDLRKDAAGGPLKDTFTRAFEYSDCWVDDARMVMMNARDAAARGAQIMLRTKVEAARREGDLWQVEVVDQITGARQTHRARALINASGPWVERVIHDVLGTTSPDKIRLVRGSHIVTRKLFDDPRPYIFQGGDGRIVFAIPFEQDYTLIGTTDAEHGDNPGEGVVCTDAERDYLCTSVSTYFKTPVTPADVVWTYSGVRPLYDDGTASASKATRDYVLRLDEAGAPALHIFGGKLTTYRVLAEASLQQVAKFFPNMGPAWTNKAALPGGDFPVDGVPGLVSALTAQFPFLDANWARRLVRAYGTEAARMLGSAKTSDELGQDFGATLTAREVEWMIEREWARTVEDILWRRSKLGLLLSPDQVAALEQWLAARVSEGQAAAQ